MRKSLSRDELLALLPEWVLGTAGIIASIHCLVSAFFLARPGLLLAPVLLAVLLPVFRLPKSGWIAGGAALVLLAAGFLFCRSLLSSFLCLWDVICSFYARGYGFFSDLMPALEPERRELIVRVGTGPALQALAVIQVYFTALSLSCWRRALPACLALLLGVFPCYVLTDTCPALTPLLTVLLVILVLILTQNTRRRRSGELAKTLGWMTVLAAGLLLAVTAFFPFQAQFQPPVTWEQIRKAFERVGSQVNTQGNASAGLSGNPRDVDLRTLRRLPDDPTPVMLVRTDYEGLLYLKGSAYNLFDGRGWARDERHDRSDRLLFPCLGQRSGTCYLSVTPWTGERLYYIPYGLSELPAGVGLRSDAYLPNDDPMAPYSLRFAADPESGTPAQGWEAEDYAAYVTDSCLALPETTRQGVLDWWVRQGGSVSDETEEGQEETRAAQTAEGRYIYIGVDGAIIFYSDSEPDLSSPVASVAEEAARKVSACASYSRNPSRMPGDRPDFCTWFLTEAESGYCVHYATACTALLRALGIPARYVSGYVCRTEANKELTVTSLQAHAWVEYFDAGAWHRLEPTPGDATEFTGRIPQPAEPTRPSETRPTEPREPSETEPAQPTAEPASSAPSGGSSEGKSFRLPDWAVYLLILPAALGLLILRRRLAARLREKKLQGAAPNEKALLLFRRSRRLSRYTGVKLPREAREMADKAAFSQHTLTEEELAVLQKSLDRQLALLRRANPVKQLWCRYILAWA